VGDAYSYLAYKRISQFFICFSVGKWNDYTCNEFYELLSNRVRFPTNKRKITIFSDGNKQNLTGIKNNFSQGCINYAVRKKIRVEQKVVGMVSKVMFGNISKDLISINQIDGFCSKLRERISCFTRKARSFAKKKRCIEQRLEIFSIQHNFIETKKRITPAMLEGLQSKPLTWETFFHIRLSILD
jgi:hypothetical protein